MLEKNEIVDLLCKELSYAYCDNCRYCMGEDDACGNCHRKYSGWSISEDTANYLANAIVAQGKVVEWQNDSPDIQPKTGRWKHVEIESNKSDTGYFMLPRCECSVCEIYVEQESNYCPNCGADMRSKAREYLEYGELITKGIAQGLRGDSDE